MTRIILILTFALTALLAGSAYGAVPTHVGDFNDPGATDGAPVRDYPEDGTTAQWGSLYKIGYPTARQEPLYRSCNSWLLPAGLPCLEGRGFVGEFRVRAGEQTSSTVDDGRNEAGLSNSSQVALLPDYGDEDWFGGEFRGYPGAFAFDGVAGQSIVFMQLKGSASAPYLSWSNADQNRLYLRSSYNSVNLWDSGLTFADLEQHWFRYVLHVKFGNPGFVELWTALDDGPLTQRTLAGGVTRWPGTTALSSEVDTIRERIGVYADVPFRTDHRLISGGQNLYKCPAVGDCPEGFDTVAPPVPTSGTPAPAPTPTPTPTPTPSASATPTATATPEPTATPAPAYAPACAPTCDEQIAALTAERDKAVDQVARIKAITGE